MQSRPPIGIAIEALADALPSAQTSNANGWKIASALIFAGLTLGVSVGAIALWMRNSAAETHATLTPRNDYLHAPHHIRRRISETSLKHAHTHIKKTHAEFLANHSIFQKRLKNTNLELHKARIERSHSCPDLRMTRSKDI